MAEENINGQAAEQVVLPSDEQTADAKPQEPQGQEQQEARVEQNEDKEQDIGGAIDVAAFEKEYADNGSLSDKSYEALARVGITKEIVDRYIEGRTAYAANYDEQVMSVAGGRQEYEKIVLWAKDNLSESEIASYNKAVTSKDVELARLATAGLMSKYNAANTSSSAKSIEGGASSGLSYYSSMGELVTDQKDMRYEKDAAFRQAVEDKLRRSIAAGKI